MASSATTAIDRTRARSQPKDRGRATPHRLIALAVDEFDAVSSAGGFLYDRMVSGWSVTVHLSVCHDDRPLRILGVEVVVAGDDLAQVLTTPWPDAVLVSAGLHDSNADIRTLFTRAVRARDTEAAVCGTGRPGAVSPTEETVHHHLSAAARAFKGQALLAAGAPDTTTEPTEAFTGGDDRFGTTPRYTPA